MIRRLILCDCAGSQSLEPETISQASGLTCSRVYTGLCMHQTEDAAREIAAGDAMIACQQERHLFEELANDLGHALPGFVDLRDRAGWGAAPAPAKMAALAAEAALSIPPEKSIDVVSEGTCLIIGGATAVEVAAQLCDTLAVTVLVSSAEHIPTDRSFDVVVGKLRRASGALGHFRTTFDRLQQLLPAGRGAFALGPATDGQTSECDIIFDLSGATPLFPAHEKRDGYIRADPAHPTAVAKATFDAAQMIGTFEKPLYVRLEPTLCAHSRAEQPACSRCLNVCPTGAITPAGEHVTVDPMICAGCGACAAVCPSAAISYDAPSVDVVFKRLDILARTYRKAGGKSPRLLMHDDDYGREMIALFARFGRGLPADVIPFELTAMAQFGHAEMLAALASGFAHVDILIGPKADRDVIAAQAELANAIAGQGTVSLIDPADPDALGDALSTEPLQADVEPILPIGTRRQVTRLAAKTLNPDTETITLSDGAPYGAVVVDTDACTLCLSCVSLCPSGALADNPDQPQLRFQEDACLQCGLCRNICPEDAITLTPRLNLTDAALSQEVLHEEEPFACISCGALFGVKSTVEKIMEKLAGKHAMFASNEAANLIQMCDNCRVQAQFHSTDNPFQGGTPPRPRTTDDYLSKRKDH
ncbi:4Fe-4S binding protein [Yoonia sp. 2307UL14-13]|uniref:4Fe-4S binding protein n=1 Tax=Yoonia sp. 2307UL14-13 TaxID=3126506 RepID=UPI00309FC8C4